MSDVVIDLGDMRSFAQVVRHGGFSAAERATGEPKAKLSRRVARLESALGSRLLERSTRSLRVTEVGREVFKQCEAIAASLDETRAIAGRARSTVSGSLRVSCPPGLARHLGPDLLPSFLDRYPDVSLEMHLGSARVDLIRDRFDAALRVDVEGTHDQSLMMRRLGGVDRIVVAAPALMHQFPSLSVEGLAVAPTLSLEDQAGSHRWTLIGPERQSRTITHRPRLVANDSVVVREAAVAGLGIALLPEPSCAAEIARGDLVRVLPEWHAPEGSIHIVFTAQKGMPGALRAFIDHVVEAFQATPSLDH
jgi:DNA-binding transcriptional LysR family regulator